MDGWQKITNKPKRNSILILGLAAFDYSNRSFTMSWCANVLLRENYLMTPIFWQWQNIALNCDLFRFNSRQQPSDLGAFTSDSIDILIFCERRTLTNIKKSVHFNLLQYQSLLLFCSSKIWKKRTCEWNNLYVEVCL